jgi:integrase/recombinase XerD
MPTFSEGQIEAILDALPKGWQRIAIQVLLGTGMRVGELCSLQLTDFEDDEEVAFLRIQQGKGGKFRRVPVSQKLRRELVRYLNQSRPDTTSNNLIVLRDGRPIAQTSTNNIFGRMSKKLGIQVHAHKFRHTFATQYLRNGGEIERLRRILGHTTYFMVMRYVHLDKREISAETLTSGARSEIAGRRHFSCCQDVALLPVFGSTPKVRSSSTKIERS